MLSIAIILANSFSHRVPAAIEVKPDMFPRIELFDELSNSGLLSWLCYGDA